MPPQRIAGGLGDTPGFDYRAHLESVIAHGSPAIRWVRRILAEDAAAVIPQGRWGRRWPAILASAWAMAFALVGLVAPVALSGGSASTLDHDGLPSTYERQRTHTDPHLPDTDGDGIPDGREDLDGDGLNNIWELRLGLLADWKDSDADGTPDGSEDADQDGLTNRFEISRSRTDPRMLDSDLDGLRDSVEDPDGDDLSNLGEQRFRTDPRDPDTDGDGTDDWHQDSNGDGARDGLTQDRRPVPDDLRPTLSHPFFRPVAYGICHQFGDRARLLTCVVGPAHGTKVVVVGDSHIQHWRAALERVGRARGWRMWFMTKSACPMAEIATTQRSCPVWREAALQRIAAIHPALVITSEYNEYRAANAVDDADNARLMRHGLTRTLQRLDKVAGKVVLLGDTTRYGSDPVGCLKGHLDDISACDPRRFTVVGRDRLANDRAAARAAGVTYRDTFHLSCPYDPCPLVVGDILVPYDRGHLTIRYAREVWRGIARLLPRV